MAVSNSSDFTVDRDDILDKAGQLLGIVPEGGTCSANQYTDLAIWLNMMIKSWQTTGFYLWLMDEIILFPIKDQHLYNLGGSSPSHSTPVSEFVYTSISTEAESTDTVITVDSIDNIASGDIIGVEVDSQTIHWTTVNGSPSNSEITLTSALPDAAAIGNKVYTYTQAFISKPLKVRYAFRREMEGLTDIPLDIESHENYNSLSYKFTEGYPLTLYVDPQRDEMQLYVWPVPGQSEMDDLIYMSVQRPVMDFDSSTDNPDFPQEWYLALAYNLAFYAAPVYGVSDSRFNRISGVATILKKQLEDWSTEDTSFFIQPNTDYDYS